MVLTPNLDKWAGELTLLHKKIKVDYDTIEFIINWSQQDDFWKQNVRSPGALTKHFDRLCLQAKQKVTKGRVYRV